MCEAVGNLSFLVRWKGVGDWIWGFLKKRSGWHGVFLRT